MTTIKNILLLPWWLLTLLSTAKSFKSHPIIGSRVLNRLGLHVARLCLAHAIASIRRTLYCRFGITRAHREALADNGYILINEFLDADSFANLRNDTANCEGIARQLSQGDTLTQRILLDEKATAKAPYLRAFTKHREYLRLMNYVASTLSPTLLYLQRIRNGANGKTQPDPQKNLHSDTFQPHMKAWFYLDDVPLEKGPLNYVQGSHKLTWQRIKWEYRKSVNARQSADAYSEKGSFRATAEDLAEMKLPPATALAVPANTLIIASTNGFHGRGLADAGQSRFEIWAYNRRNPFSPLPGLPFKWVGTQQMALMEWFWRRQDRRAASKGVLASWHKIARDKVLHHDP